MNVFSCNYYGMGIASIIKSLNDQIIKYKSYLLFLSETKCSYKASRLVRSIVGSFRFVLALLMGSQVV